MRIIRVSLHPVNDYQLNIMTNTQGLFHRYCNNQASYMEVLGKCTVCNTLQRQPVVYDLFERDSRGAGVGKQHSERRFIYVALVL